MLLLKSEINEKVDNVTCWEQHTINLYKKTLQCAVFVGESFDTKDFTKVESSQPITWLKFPLIFGLPEEFRDAFCDYEGADRRAGLWKLILEFLL